MKIFNFLFSIIFIYAVCIQSHCKKEEENLCLKIPLFKADFMIGETIQDSLIPTDTILNVNFQVTLKANEKYESIKWKVGEDPRNFENQQVVKLNFKPNNAGETIQVTLFAKGKSDATCPLLPNDDGLDTIVKSFTIACNKNIGGCNSTSLNINQQYLGKWKGSLDDNLNRQFVVQIVDFGEDPNSRDDTLFYDMRIYNLPEGCGGTWLPNNYDGCGGDKISPSSVAYPITEPSFKGFYSGFAASPCCSGNILMFGKIDNLDRNKIIIYVKDKSNSSLKIFRGSRV
ncbi:MAG: hypothetical protein U5L45_10965 [Saprospiraceae bacterium]|nr:hypothetical protein [Saprospiraceae bacterium]